MTRFADRPWPGLGHYVSDQWLSRKTDGLSLLFARWKRRLFRRSAFLAAIYCLDLPLGMLERSLPVLLTYLWLRSAPNVTLHLTQGDSQTLFCSILSLLLHRKCNALCLRSSYTRCSS